MYLSCYRAVEYLRSRPDWDGQTLVVQGTSQGGQQSLVTGGLYPDGVTAVIAFLPAACDVLAPKVGRAPGFPFWWTQTEGKDEAKVRSASRYYDPANFASRIKVPVYAGLAMEDDLASPSSVFAALEQCHDDEGSPHACRRRDTRMSRGRSGHIMIVATESGCRRCGRAGRLLAARSYHGVSDRRRSGRRCFCRRMRRS